MDVRPSDSDEVVLVTGTSTGIGAALSLHLARVTPRHFVVLAAMRNAADREEATTLRALATRVRLAATRPARGWDGRAAAAAAAVLAPRTAGTTGCDWQWPAKGLARDATLGGPRVRLRR